MPGQWPHRPSCRCAECASVGLTTRREQREHAKREIARILAMRPARAPFPEADDAA